MQDRLVIDIETVSTEDLRKSGAHRYAEHPDTDVLCVCYKFANTSMPVAVWTPGCAVPRPGYAVDHIERGGAVVAHNRQFEAQIFEHVLGPKYGWPVPAKDTWSCTMARAQYHGLPAGLDLLGDALNLTHRKSRSGHALMLRMCRPRGFQPDGSPRWWHLEDPIKRAMLVAYCKDDVLSEEELDRKLPELPSTEREVWLLDGDINDRGLVLDTDAIDALQLVIDAEMDRLDQAMRTTTQGTVRRTTNVKALTEWLIGRGWAVTSLDKGSIPVLLASQTAAQDPDGARALRTRAEAAKASTAKLKSMKASVSKDARAKGLFAFYGAGRTGRWAGRRVQPQNLVRGLKDPGAVIEFVLTAPPADAYGLDVLWDDAPLDTIAKSLRAVITAAPGNMLVVADLAQIEARVVAWLAGQSDVLDVFRRGEDVYTYAAAKQGSDNRQFGKLLTLALGFGMGWEKFTRTGVSYGVFLDEADARQAVYEWRGQNHCIMQFWWSCDDAARSVINGPEGGFVRVGHVRFRKTRQAMRIVLPSGRELVYQFAEIAPDATNPTRTEIVFKGVHGLTKQWARLRTYGGKLCENITQAVARDIMVWTMLRLRQNNLPPPVGSVHDELIQEVGERDAQRTLDLTLALMRCAPGWCPTLPVDAEGFITKRYRK